MLAIPFRLNAEEYSLLICLDDTNIGRIREYDPAGLMMSDITPGIFAGLRLRQVSVGYANSEDISIVTGLVNEGKSTEAIQYLTRGWQLRPDLGDYDGPPLNLKIGKDETRQ